MSEQLLLCPPDVKTQFAITPAHPTMSFIEAWFSLVQLMSFDEAIKYCSGVANRHMAQALKSALNSNLYYDLVDVGEIKENITEMGPVDLVKFLTVRYTNGPHPYRNRSKPILTLSPSKYKDNLVNRGIHCSNPSHFGIKFSPVNKEYSS